jgi:hypothetical protein
VTGSADRTTVNPSTTTSWVAPPGADFTLQRKLRRGALRPYSAGF